MRTPPPATVVSSSSSSPSGLLRYAVLGAGVAGLSVAYHLLKQTPKHSNLRVDIFDEVGICGGASGVSVGILHPYSPKGKLLWRAGECWDESMRLLTVHEEAAAAADDDVIVRGRGILRPALSTKNMMMLEDVMYLSRNNARNGLAGCRIEAINKESTQKLVPGICVPFDRSFYMPEAVNIDPQCYLQALYLACQKLVKELCASRLGVKELRLHKDSIHKLLDLEGTRSYCSIYAHLLCLCLKVQQF